ncbi:MAG: fumarate hydratase [Acidobacteria bacterium]|nr:MAG: fumarate hydratase [Acidobacteriota bacterium]
MDPRFRENLIALITRTSTDLPPDVRAAMQRATGREVAEHPQGNQATQALNIIGTNIQMAAGDEGPVCQDTGMPTFFIHTPVGFNQILLRREILAALEEATRRGKLRPNSVDSLTGTNSGNNLGPGTPVIHFEQWENDSDVEIKLLLKGGGCENKNIQYSLPCTLDHLGRAGRDMDGIRKCILHAVWQAQGQGCAPGALGVAIGGDRTSGYDAAKQQLLRPLDDTNSDSRLAELETYVLDRANTLGIGTMGFGGGVSLIGCKATALNRLPASFFVSVAYDCWAYRRRGLVLDAASGAVRHWLYGDPPLAGQEPKAPESVEVPAGIHLRAPVAEADIRKLKVGDMVLISGVMVTGRDAVHGYLMHNDPPVDLRDAVLYHCGPVVRKDAAGAWTITAAGPTTSIREEPYEADLLRRFGMRVIIGKGGMGPKTLAALQECGAVYLNAVGGAAQYYGRAIKKVRAVHLLEFGTPEAMWELEVENFPAVVTMDSHGHSLHDHVREDSGQALHALEPETIATHK